MATKTLRLNALIGGGIIGTPFYEMKEKASTYKLAFKQYAGLGLGSTFGIALEDLRISVKVTDAALKDLTIEGKWYECREPILFNDWNDCTYPVKETWTLAEGKSIKNKWTKK